MAEQERDRAAVEAALYRVGAAVFVDDCDEGPIVKHRALIVHNPNADVPLPRDPWLGIPEFLCDDAGDWRWSDRPVGGRIVKPFGVRSTVERVTAKLAERHWMFQGGGQRLDVLKMCEDCRVIAVTEQDLDLYAAPARPCAPPRTICTSGRRATRRSPRPN